MSQCAAESGSRIDVAIHLFLLVCLFVAAACMTQAAIGFGGNLIAMPLVALVEPDLVPAAVLVAVTAQNGLMMLRDRHAIQLTSVSSALVGRAVGTVVAIFVLRSITESGLQLAVAVTVLLLVVLTAIDRAPHRTPATMVGAGTISGFFAATAGIGGPPVALMFQRDPGPNIRGSMGGFFVVGTTITLIGLALAGRLGGYELRWGLAMVPAAVVGFVMSGPLLPIVDRGYMRPAVLTVSSAAAVSIIVRLVVS